MQANQASQATKQPSEPTNVQVSATAAAQPLKQGDAPSQPSKQPSMIPANHPTTKTSTAPQPPKQVNQPNQAATRQPSVVQANQPFSYQPSLLSQSAKQSSKPTSMQTSVAAPQPPKQANSPKQANQPNQAIQPQQANQPNQANPPKQTNQPQQVNQPNQAKHANEPNTSNQLNKASQPKQSQQPQPQPPNQASNQPTRQSNMQHSKFAGLHPMTPLSKRHKFAQAPITVGRKVTITRDEYVEKWFLTASKIGLQYPDLWFELPDPNDFQIATRNGKNNIGSRNFQDKVDGCVTTSTYAGRFVGFKTYATVNDFRVCVLPEGKCLRKQLPDIKDKRNHVSKASQAAITYAAKRELAVVSIYFRQALQEADVHRKAKMLERSQEGGAAASPSGVSSAGSAGAAGAATRTPQHKAIRFSSNAKGIGSRFAIAVAMLDDLHSTLLEEALLNDFRIELEKKDGTVLLVHRGPNMTVRCSVDIEHMPDPAQPSDTVGGINPTSIGVDMPIRVEVRFRQLNEPVSSNAFSDFDSLLQFVLEAIDAKRCCGTTERANAYFIQRALLAKKPAPPPPANITNDPNGLVPNSLVGPALVGVVIAGKTIAAVHKQVVRVNGVPFERHFVRSVDCTPGVGIISCSNCINIEATMRRTQNRIINAAWKEKADKMKEVNENLAAVAQQAEACNASASASVSASKSTTPATTTPTTPATPATTVTPATPTPITRPVPTVPVPVKVKAADVDLVMVMMQTLESTKDKAKEKQNAVAKLKLSSKKLSDWAAEKQQLEHAIKRTRYHDVDSSGDER